MYPIVVRAKHGSIIGVLIDDPFAALAWRAYTPNVVKMGQGKPDLSGWVGLNPVLGGVQQLDAAFDAADEALQAIVGGFTGRFDQVAKNAGVIIQNVWKGIREKQDAANAVVGNYLYNYGKYQAALNIFSMLTVYKPFVSKYWRAAGAANQALKNYREAITAYDMALSTNANDAVSFTYRGESKLAAGKEVEGIEDLKQAITTGLARPVYAQWVNRARTLLTV